MNIEKLTIRGNPNIGIYLFANDHIALAPPILEPKEIEIVEKTLRVPLVLTTIGGMTIVGVLVTGNNKGIILPSLIRDTEFQRIKSSYRGNVAVVRTRYTALGNICLVNDYAALIHPEAYPEIKDIVKDTLEVEVVEKGTIAGIPTVGSAAVITNKGGLVHPDASDEEVDYLTKLFRVPVAVGTVNFGIGFIRSGLVANSFGVLVGGKTTGPEMLRISQVFGVSP